MKFQLEKWYLDCTTENSEFIILYFAHIKYGVFYTSYSGIIGWNREHGDFQKQRFSHKSNIVNDGTIITLSNSLAKGKWKNIAGKSIIKKLLTSAEGNIEWSCHQPLSEVKIESVYGNFDGFGYAEKIQMDIKPWKLPIRELYWGRVCGRNFFSTWIKWKGDHPVDILLVNEVLYEDFHVSDERIWNDNFEMRFRNKKLIRKGKINQSVMKKFHWLKIILPLKALWLDELKYFAEVQVSGLNETCRSIYETVKWPE